MVFGEQLNPVQLVSPMGLCSSPTSPMDCKASNRRFQTSFSRRTVLSFRTFRDDGVHVSVELESELLGISLDYVAIHRRKRDRYFRRSSRSNSPLLQFMQP